MQARIGGFLTDGTLRLHVPREGEVERILVLLDSDFYIYRLADGRALEVVPGPETPR